MTHDEMIEVIRHHRDGGKVQVFDSWHPVVGWSDVLGDCDWDFFRFRYRPKPALKRIPLGPEDVKPGDWVRNRKKGYVFLVTGVGPSGIYVNGHGWTFDGLEACFGAEISSDGGQTWRPCWKEVEE